MNNLKTKGDDLDLDKLKIVPIGLKKLIEVVNKEGVKNTKFSSLKTKVDKLDKKTSGATTLIHVNEYNTRLQNKK